MTIDKMRRDYRVGVFDVESALADPIAQFDLWFQAARETSPGDWFEVNAMTLATADKAGNVSARILLLKGFDHGGPVFFSNYLSDKGRQLTENPQASLCFYWPHREQQIRIEGRVEKVSPELSDEYFQSRPRGSQLGAMVSQQSSPVNSRLAMETRLTELEQEFAAKQIPRPAHWGGYRVLPSRYEFWQGRENRLHDRIVYRATNSGGWLRERISP